MRLTKKPTDILIVDDREDGLLALEAVLRPLPDTHLVRARSGVEALDIVATGKHEFAVILLDVQMPILDGFQTANLIRKKFPKCAHTPIIFVTAINKDDQYIYKGYEAGAVDYVFKPFEPQILRSKVSVFLELFRQSQQIADQTRKLLENEMREQEIKLVEQEVESLKSYRTLADAIPHMIWKARLDGTLDYFNKGWLDYTGLTQAESSGLGWQQCLMKEDLNPFLKVWIQSMPTNSPFEFEARIRDREGNYKWHWIRAVPAVRRSGRPGWIGTCTNIHDRKTSEEKLLLAQQEAESANLAKTNFLANMSHEIRTPMSAILGFADLMQHSEQTEEQRMQSISTIQKNGKQLLAIIDEILDISKVETGFLEVEKINFNIVNMFSEIVSLLRLQVDRKGLDFKINVISKIPIHVLTDPTRLRQILMNVIGNAIKFTEKGSITVNVEWRTESASANTDRLIVRVQDTGVGIEKRHVDRLFQPFAQEDTSTTRKFGGTGLGLALSRKFAQALGGDVSIESTEAGAGSTFRVEVDAQAVAGTDWVDSFTQSEKAKPQPVPQDTNALKGVNVLLVDDAEDNQTVIGFFLNSAGAHVEFADNGLEGVEKALQGDYNVVLMDIQMPNLDGYQATQRLRNEGYDKPIVALTAHAMKEERERCLRSGCTEHFTKPVDRSKLIKLVSKMVHDQGQNSP